MGTKRRETIQDNTARHQKEAAERQTKIDAARQRIVPITLDMQGTPAFCIATRMPFKMVDDFFAVVDARTDLPTALKTARELIQDPAFQAVSMVRESQTLGKSFKALDKFTGVEGRFEKSPRGLHVLPWLERNKHLYVDPGLTTLINNKSLGFWRANWAFGPDFHEISCAARPIFPEVLSWSIRRSESSKPGQLHYDDYYRPGKNSLLDLPKSFRESVDKERFYPLPGNTTLIYAVSQGPLICKTETLQPYQNFYFDENELTAYQAQDGDLMLKRAQGWDHEKGFMPVFHCSPLITQMNSQRFVAVASSNWSYLSPQIRESMGRSRLPSDNLLEQFRDLLDIFDHTVKPGILVEAFRAAPSGVLQQVTPEMLDRFPEQTIDQIRPFLLDSP